MNTYAVFESRVDTGDRELSAGFGAGQHIGDMIFRTDKAAFSYLQTLATTYKLCGARMAVCSKYKGEMTITVRQSTHITENDFQIHLVKQ